MNSVKICTICKQQNVNSALVCSNCGAVLEDNPTGLVALPDNFSGRAVTTLIDVNLIPEDGVGIQVEGSAQPFYVSIYRELILGRQADATLEAVLDLSQIDTYNMGLSRRHAILRRVDFGFEVIDLSSRNGTWLNGEHLIPNKPYPFASGSQLLLGRLAMVIVYRVPGKDQK